MRTYTSKSEMKSIYKQEINLLKKAKQLQSFMEDEYEIKITLSEALKAIKEAKEIYE